MVGEVLGGLALVGTGAFLYARAKRQGLYAQLAASQADLIRACPPVRFEPGIVDSRPAFDGKLATLRGVLAQETWQLVAGEVERLVESERSYLPAHKKGGTVAYETLNRQAPNIVALYLAPEFQGLIGRITGERVVPTPLNDQSSLSVLFYEKPGDHIGWHYDHNFYRGRHFTVLLPIVNTGTAPGGLSHAQLMARRDAGEMVIATPPNDLVVFEGAKVQHKVTPIAEGERRVVLSMTYCCDPRNAWWQGAARRIKDTAFFGLRALWT